MSKQIPLTQGKFAIVDDENYDWLSRYKWHAVKNYNNCYAARKIYKDGKWITISMHREILNPPADMETDHVGHDGLNNRISNLRIATRAENQHNRRSQGHSSKFKGITWLKNNKKWVSRISFNCGNIYLGCFNSETDAAKAYNEMAKKLFGEYACLNEI